MITIKKCLVWVGFFLGGGGQIIANGLFGKIIYHIKSSSVNRFQNGFKIVKDL